VVLRYLYASKLFRLEPRVANERFRSNFHNLISFVLSLHFNHLEHPMDRLEMDRTRYTRESAARMLLHYVRGLTHEAYVHTPNKMIFTEELVTIRSDLEHLGYSVRYSLPSRRSFRAEQPRTRFAERRHRPPFRFCRHLLHRTQSWSPLHSFLTRNRPRATPPSSRPSLVQFFLPVPLAESSSSPRNPSPNIRSRS